MKIKDFHKFQHFKNRRPPWIKLYREILDDYDISQLSDKAFRVLVSLWLLASEDEKKKGNLPDINSICFRLRMPKQAVDKVLQELDNFVISKGYQDDTPETEERREETEESIAVTSTYVSWNNEEFLESIVEGNEKAKLSQDEYGLFYDYWTEPDPKGKQRFKLQKTWDTARRLNTWKKNSFNNKPAKQEQSRWHS